MHIGATLLVHWKLTMGYMGYITLCQILLLQVHKN